MEKRQIKILHQSLKTKWYRMIEAGIKTEEYRSLTAYWLKRLVWDDYFEEPISDDDIKFFLGNPPGIENMFDCGWSPVPYTHVQFSLGYPKKGDESRRITFELNGIFTAKVVRNGARRKERNISSKYWADAPRSTERNYGRTDP